MSADGAQQLIEAAQAAGQAAIADLSRPDTYMRAYWLSRGGDQLSALHEAKMQYARLVGTAKLFVDTIIEDVFNENSIEAELPRLRAQIALMSAEEIRALISYCARGHKRRVKRRLVCLAIARASGNNDAAVAAAQLEDEPEPASAASAASPASPAPSTRAPQRAIELPHPRIVPSARQSHRQAQLAGLTASVPHISPESLVLQLRRILADAEADVARAARSAAPRRE